MVFPSFALYEEMQILEKHSRMPLTISHESHHVMKNSLGGPNHQPTLIIYNSFRLFTYVRLRKGNFLGILGDPNLASESCVGPDPVLYKTTSGFEFSNKTASRTEHEKTRESFSQIKHRLSNTSSSSNVQRSFSTGETGSRHIHRHSRSR